MRPTRDQVFMSVAQIFSSRATCYRLNVGCIITIDNRTVSHGYNGPPSGETHCLGNDCPLSKSGGCTRSNHAEANALDFVKHETRPMTLYVTHSPCPHCVDKILERNVVRVVYGADFRDTTALHKLFDKGIVVERLTPSGYLVNLRTNEIKEAQ